MGPRPVMLAVLLLILLFGGLIAYAAITWPQ